MPHLIQSYARLDIYFSYGKGVFLYDQNDQEYLDAITGIGVNALGHNHPKITETIAKQSQKIIHSSNLYQIKSQEDLADKLCQISGLDAVFFTNSGTESSECAIKLTRLFARHKGYSHPKVIVFDGGFHGRSFAGLSATSNPKVREGFEPLLDGFISCHFNDLDSVEKAFVAHSDIAAIFIEPIQGEGGINIATDSFLKGLKELCIKHDALLIFDEVQCGMGRTGNWFAAHSINGIDADIVTLAKPLGAGVPIGACLVNEKANLFIPGKHGTTFGGSPFACQTALTFLETMEQDQLLINVQNQSQRLVQGIKKIFNSSHFQIRSKGLMIGIEVAQTNEAIKKALADLPKNALQHGLLINVTSGNVIRLLPPFIINEKEVDLLLNKLQTLKEQYLV